MKKGLLAILSMGLIGGCLAGSNAAVTVTVSTGAPAGLQSRFIADATNQYIGTVTPTPYFLGSYSMKLDRVNPAYLPPVVSTTVATLDGMIRFMVAKTTWSYVYGFANGMDYQRNTDMSVISSFIVNCDSPTYFGVLSTASWNQAVCTTALMVAEQSIYDLKVSTPILIPPGGF